MAKILIIPELNEIEESLALSKEYGAGFEFNDFFAPNVLDSVEEQERIIGFYKKHSLPELTTLHGAFYDVTIFSPDKRIAEISDMRIRQSIDMAKRIGASAVIFHTNYNPFLNTDAYKKLWVEHNAEYWTGILKEFSDISIYLENMFDTSPELLSELSKELCSFKNYGVCLDYAHASLSDMPTKVWVEELSSYIKHIHINDNNLDCDSHMALGKGKIDWQEFYSLYNKNMSEATVLVETTSISDQKTSLEKLRLDRFL